MPVKADGILRLVGLPKIEIGAGLGLRKSLPGIAADARRLDLQADEFHIVLGDEPGDLGQRHLMFLHMEQHVAAFAGGEEVEIVHDLPRRRRPVQRQNRLPALPDTLDASAQIRVPAMKARAALTAERPILL